MTYLFVIPECPPVRHAGADRHPVFINFPGSRPPPGRRGSAPLFISGFRLGPRRNDPAVFHHSHFVISECPPDRHTGEGRYPVIPFLCHTGADRHP